MQSTNRSCNTLQTALGIFLHSCGAPETVRELLAHMGLSISTTSINEAISNLSKEAIAETRKIGNSLLTTYAYDNLDIDLKHSTPTVENSAETLIHITSGTCSPSTMSQPRIWTVLTSYGKYPSLIPMCASKIY